MSLNVHFFACVPYFFSFLRWKYLRRAFIDANYAPHFALCISPSFFLLLLFCFAFVLYIFFFSCCTMHLNPCSRYSNSSRQQASDMLWHLVLKTFSINCHILWEENPLRNESGKAFIDLTTHSSSIDMALMSLYHWRS